MPASHDNFNKAREMFTQIGEQVPAVREVTDMLLGLAEDQTVFAEVMNAMNDPGSFTSQGGYINARLDDMKRRALPETRPYSLRSFGPDVSSSKLAIGLGYAYNSPA